MPDKLYIPVDKKEKELIEYALKFMRDDIGDAPQKTPYSFRKIIADYKQSITDLIIKVENIK